MKKKFGLIQICRGLAALAVVGYHLNGSATDYFNSSFLGSSFIHGSLGVDFFFVLSGFIITYVHFKDIQNRTNKTQFLLKRFIRIYPIYWVFCSAFLAILLIVFHGKTEHNHVDLTSLNDWGIILTNYLLVTHHEDFYLVVAWTLSFEILFYLIFVLCIRLGLRGAKIIYFIWASLVLFKLIFPNWLPDTILFHERIAEFLIGCFVAYTILKLKPFPKYLWLSSFIIMILASIITYPIWLKNPWGTLFLAIINGLIIYKFVQIDSIKEHKYPKFLMLIGEASYSIYLSHFLFFSILLRIMRVLIIKLNIQGNLTIQFILAILFGITLVGGILVYQLIEKPMTKYLTWRFIHKNKLKEV